MSLNSTRETRILCVGDMHLGRSLPSLPPEADARRLGPRAAWERVVQTAVEQQVHAVALAGDLVDSGNALFEAYGLLQQGLARLADAGIAVCAVAGNHDTEVLPRLARELDRFHLLGRDGTWSAFTVEPDQGPAVRLVGWSFPARHHPRSPLETALPAAEPGVVTLGLLHGDLDATSSDYAPVGSADLAAAGYDGWFLGHEHKPGAVPRDGSPFYLGSLTPLTPNETGLHGPVLVTVLSEGGGNGGPAIHRRRLPLAPLRWEHLAVDCSALTDPENDLPGHVLHALSGRLKALKQDGVPQLQALGVRLALTGSSEQPEALRRALDRLEPDQLAIPDDTVAVFVQKIENRVTPRVDLAALARETHPAGILARQILLLQGAEPADTSGQAAAAERSELLRAARETVAAVDRSPQFAPLAAAEDSPARDEAVLDEAALTGQLLRIAQQALAHLLASREEGDLAAD